MHNAVTNGHENIVKLLVNNGADVDAENLAHETPLFNSASQSNENITEFLLKNGAKVFYEHLLDF